jgi:protein-S-isoprenylcysteine O-methyltransferase Ste14
VVISWLTRVQTGLWTVTLVESAVILANSYPSHPLSQHVLEFLTGSPYPTITPLRITGTFLAGTLLTLAGSAFRIASFRALGKHFTYELSLQKGHQLVKAFPYSVVRHPGYTGALGAVVGINLVLFGARGGFLREVVLERLGWDDVPRKGLATAAMLGLGFAQAGVMAALLARVPKEDAMMRDEFREEWEVWAKDVPYKLIPGIY